MIESTTTPFSGEPTASTPEFPGFTNIFENTGEADVVEPTPHRREFLAISSAAMLAAAGCRRPDLQILPYSQTPDNIVPGMPLYYATSMPRPGGCFPLLVETHEGRPTKIEGNPKHPASMGATDAYAQAAILDLYSPDRSKEVLKRNKDGQLQKSSWEEFDVFATEHFSKLRKSGGEGLRFLIEDDTSPALRLLREHIKTRFPNAVWHVHEPIDNANVLAGTKHTFGQALLPAYDLAKAERIFSLDCDFLGMDSQQTVNSGAFAKGRSASRLYALESAYSVTGTMADHHLRIPATHVADYVIALARTIAADRSVAVPAPIKEILDKAPAPNVVIPEAWLEQVAADLIAFKGKSLILAGYRQSPVVHALVAFLNGILKSPVAYLPIVKEENRSLSELAASIRDDKVKSLIVVGGNPAFNAPSDLVFAATLDKVPSIIRLGLFADETSAKAHWHLPRTHFLESWGDAETSDGTYSAIQPMIAPLHNGRSLLELLILISGYENASSFGEAKPKVYGLLQKSFAKRAGQDDELSFKRFIQEGFLKDSARSTVATNLNETAIGNAILYGDSFSPEKIAALLSSSTTTSISNGRSPVYISEKNLEVTFHPSYALYDGRYAWNAWLLELPDPLTKLVWDNAALVSPKTAAFLQVKTGDMLEITVKDSSIKIPAFIMPGQADYSIALSLGWGKLRPSHIAEGGGFDVYPIRFADGLHFTTAKVKKTGERYDLVVTQEHGTIPEDRKSDIIRDQPLHHEHESEHHDDHHHTDDPRKRFQWGYENSAYNDAGEGMNDIKRIALQTADDLSFPQRLDGHMQWGMVIDLNTCTGCSACVIACQAENNIPIVGKHEVKLNREMHWISLHRYFMQSQGPITGGLEQAPAEDPTIVSQPMMCQQCEAAPCESVCPVNAAVHSPEGLNLQVYNRCIGTRYCSNNCPYKARRFNWFDFNKRRIDELRVPTPFSEAGMPETLKMQKNPEVTVRMRGVMEKCTYCIQRIERGKLGAKVLAIKAGADKADTPPTTDAKKEYQQGYAIRVLDGISRIIVPDGIIHTACEQACPSGSIVFGNVRDKNSRVYKMKNDKHHPDYLALGSLNTKPRTSYLPRIRNLNPRMLAPEAHS